ISCSYLSIRSTATPLDLSAFPTRRSSDITEGGVNNLFLTSQIFGITILQYVRAEGRPPHEPASRAEQPRWPARLAGSCGGLPSRSEEHTSELQSRENPVCRLLLEKKHLQR